MSFFSSKSSVAPATATSKDCSAAAASPAYLGNQTSSSAPSSVIADDSKVGDKYVLVRVASALDSNDDVKSKGDPLAKPALVRTSGVPDSSKMRSIMRSTKMVPTGKLGKAMPVVRTKIWNSGSAAGSAATQFNTVVSLTPSTCAEFTQFANLYDECRVRGVTLHFSTLVATSTGSQPITMHGNVVYDPVDNTAYTSLLTSLAAQQKTGLLAVGTNQFGAFAAASSWATAPTVVSKNGLFMLKIKAPSGPHAAVNGTPSGASTFFTEGLWYAVSNLTSGTDIYGYIKPYFEALANSTFQWEYWLEYDMEFRSRT